MHSKHLSLMWHSISRVQGSKREWKTCEECIYLVKTIQLIMKIRGCNSEDLKEINESIEQMENPFSFEKYCHNCDHFPGDLLYNKREYYGVCPFKEKFTQGKFNGDTEWKKINCKEFWD